MLKSGFALLLMMMMTIPRVDAAGDVRVAVGLVQYPQGQTPAGDPPLGLAGWREVLTRRHESPVRGDDWPEAVSAPPPRAAADAVPVAPPANGYVKQTEFDNTPYRFNMTQNGKRMTADDFDAWLKANGYSVGRRVEQATTPD